MEGVEDDLVDRTLGVLVPVDRALDDVAQLANVAGPRIGLERGERARREAGPIGPVELGRHAPPEMLGRAAGYRPRAREAAAE